ncbi:hypothetical protein MMC24_000839 [Lignoscripta atroalba]|nr:hypothetical protein [Lignoscripta atroalba]
MPGRGRRRASSRNPSQRTTSGSIRRSNSGSTSRNSRTPQRRSARLSDLAAARQDEVRRQDDTNRRVPSESTQIFSQANLTARAVVTSTSAEQSAPNLSLPEGLTPLEERSNTHLATREGQEPVTADGSLTPSMDGIPNRPVAYDLIILLQPSSEIRPGALISPPIVLRLDRRVGQSSEDHPPHDPALLWAFVSIVSEDGTRALAPPRDDLLRGTVVGSVQPLNPTDEAQGVGFIVFPGISIQQSGQYRIRISLMRMDIDRQVGTPSFQGGINLQSTVTRIIHVHPGAGPSILG